MPGDSEPEYFEYRDEYLENEYLNDEDDSGNYKSDSSLRYPGRHASKEGVNYGSSATHTSMPDLNARAKLCEYLANDLQDTTP